MSALRQKRTSATGIKNLYFRLIGPNHCLYTYAVPKQLGRAPILCLAAAICAAKNRYIGPKVYFGFG
jgi:hypothetical protein